MNLEKLKLKIGLKSEVVHFEFGNVIHGTGFLGGNDCDTVLR
jgi:hypothetical protein